jgi:hypothetical protein
MANIGSPGYTELIIHVGFIHSKELAASFFKKGRRVGTAFLASTPLEIPRSKVVLATEEV